MPPPRVRGVHVGAVSDRAHLSAEAVLPDQVAASDRNRLGILYPAFLLLRVLRNQKYVSFS